MLSQKTYQKVFMTFLFATFVTTLATSFLAFQYYRARVAHTIQQQDVTIKDYSERSQKINSLHHTRIHFIIALIILITMITILATKALHGNIRSWWLVSIVYSLSLMFAIVTFWYIENGFGSVRIHDNIIDDKEDLNHFLKKHKDQNPEIYKIAHHIVPMGFLAYSIQIKDSESKIDTYAWAKYNNQKDATIMQPFKMANVETILTPNKILQGDDTVLVWNTNTTSPQVFNYQKYPFDYQEIILDFYHPDFSADVILIPDFDAYSHQYARFPQMRQDVRIERWTITDGYFYYVLTNYATNFSIKNNPQQKNFPYLRYVIELQRNAFNPLISTLLPILIILFILFAVLLILGRVENKKGALTSVVGMLSGLFFATVVADQTFDRTLNAPGIVYFKTFYYIVYAVIFLVAINCLLYLLDNNKVITYEHNIIARILFWPIVSTFFFIVTMIFFYNLL